MDPVEEFQRKADEARELFFRYMATRPTKSGNAAALKNRWEAKDPNVTQCNEGDGVFSYSLKFTKLQLAELKSAYVRFHPRSADKNLLTHEQDGVEFEAGVFVKTIEDWGAAIDVFRDNMPEEQKARKRSMESINVALLKLDQALAELDTDALGYWYGHVVDAVAKSGLQLSAADNRLVSMLNHPVRATVEGLELRRDLRAIINASVTATTAAADRLPKFDRVRYDPRYTTAVALERFIIEHSIAFDSTENGFAAICLRAMLDLAGVEYEKISYWLKKAEDNEDSHARWLQRMRGEG